jgi:hypothetical protein
VAVPHRFLMIVLVTRGVHVGIRLKLKFDSYDGNQGTAALEGLDGTLEFPLLAGCRLLPSLLRWHGWSTWRSAASNRGMIFPESAA